MSVVRAVRSVVEGTVVAVQVAPGDEVAATTAVLVVELMKMQQPVVAGEAGVLVEVLVSVGDEVQPGDVVARVDLEPAPAAIVQLGGDGDAGGPPAAGGGSADLDALRARLHLTTDEGRPEAVARRAQDGSRTARANVLDLLDDGSFVEYGALAHAAQRTRRSAEELRTRTPADGIVTGIGTVAGTQVAVAAYDATVLAGTQGHTSHEKLDRILGVAHELRLPFVLYAEGGGGRPGDTDVVGGAWLGVPTFRLLARLSGVVPVLAVVHGRCFAGNAALAGCADVVVATEGSVLGMAGPAMVAGGGLGTHDADDLGPVAAHRATGAVDVVVADEAAATAVVRDLLHLLSVPAAGHDGQDGDPELLRRLVPADPRRPHDVDALLAGVLDPGTAVELRPEAGRAIRTVLGRVRGHAVGVLANDPRHMAGAIDGPAAESAARFLSLCDAHGLPVVSLVDTPGFMVGPESDADAAVRRTSRLFLAGAHLRVPLVAVVVRRAFGLGAMAMVGGDMRAPVATFTWPSASLGPMGLEGAVRLGARRELDAIEDEAAREARVEELTAAARAHASALNVATFAEVDEVIDPASTRARIDAVLRAAHVRTAGARQGPPPGYVQPF